MKKQPCSSPMIVKVKSTQWISTNYKNKTYLVSMHSLLKAWAREQTLKELCIVK